MEPEEENGKPGEFRWHTDKRGRYIRLWELPKEGVPYIMGCDTTVLIAEETNYDSYISMTLEL